MDLQSAQQGPGQQWTWAKLAAFLCFMMAGGMLIGSLALNSRPLAVTNAAHAIIVSIA